ncbi:Elongation factor G [Pseudobythopirellula maris]|uniref:Elongation factor G n=1 Tax=Pseudobythopirellula maris TaxID=2527991 RepID=A0A5C5ZNX6_9BACT|nr:elongation factor G [Pseudobythopirellula maris]TWT88133.1 Elongation factor G [Pseudobythopirellula maris]
MPDFTKLRNLGVIAHIDAGKTTVTERMLYLSGARHRAGEVDLGTTTTDDDAEEQERGITIYSACVQMPWKDVRINLIDTPGHVDFTAEVERSLRVLDGAVVVFSAREGVEAQSETVWRQANRYHVPRLAFINKLDREGADWEAVLEEIENRLGATPIALQIPAGQGPPHQDDPFRGVVDLIRMRLLTFPGGKEGREVKEEDVPEELAVEAQLWRERMVEQLCDFSDELMELALSGEPIPETLLKKVIRAATVHEQVQPVLVGSALHGMGVQPLLDAVADYLPHPLEMPPVVGEAPAGKAATKKQRRAAKAHADDGEQGAKGNRIARKPDPAEPFCGLVFKILPFKTGDLYWVRIYSGVLKPNSRVMNAGRDLKENVSQIWRIHATKKDEQLEAAEAGEIVALLGLRDSVTGDTLCDAAAPIVLESIEFPDTVISMAIEAENSTEKKKMGEVLAMLRKQDPTFRAEENEETGQTLISGMGELHLEVIQHRLARDFGLKVKVHKPRVSYRETIGGKAEVTGECHRLMNGVQHTAAVRVRVEPFTPTGPLAAVAPPVVVSVAPGHGLPDEFLNVVVEELENAAGGGGSVGFPLMRMKVTVTGGEVHETDSTEIAFRTAASLAFDKGLREAGVVLLEPIMKLEITAPENHVGDLVGDLQQRRAIIHRTEQRGADTVLLAEAPLANLFGYSSAMRSLSQGRAGCSMTPSGYSAAPDEVLQKFLGE